MPPPGPSLAAIDLAVLRNSRRMRASLDLSAAEWSVLLVVVTAAVHRYLSAPHADPRFLDGRPLPPHLVGRTSRRRVDDVTGLPLETVRRIVARLAASGRLREDAAGLHGAGGMYAHFAEIGLLQQGMHALAVACSAEPALAAARLQAEPRLASYQLANIGLQLHLSLGRQYALPPASLELFLTLLLQPPSAVSERDAARALALPRETLRRHAARLAARGLLADGVGPPRVSEPVRTRHADHPEAAERLTLATRLRRTLDAPPISANASAV